MPVPDCFYINVFEIFPYFRISEIQNACLLAFTESQKLILKMLPGFCFFPDLSNGKP